MTPLRGGVGGGRFLLRAPFRAHLSGDARQIGMVRVFVWFVPIHGTRRQPAAAARYFDVECSGSLSKRGMTSSPNKVTVRSSNSCG